MPLKPCPLQLDDVASDVLSRPIWEMTVEFQTLIEQALAVRRKYAGFEKDRYGREWSREEIMLGFLGDVGDLAKLVQSKEGVRHIDDLEDKLAHELSDCLWSIIVLADRYEVDLQAAFVTTMTELSAHLGD